MHRKDPSPGQRRSQLSWVSCLSVLFFFSFPACIVVSVHSGPGLTRDSSRYCCLICMHPLAHLSQFKPLREKEKLTAPAFDFHPHRSQLLVRGAPSHGVAAISPVR